MAGVTVVEASMEASSTAGAAVEVVNLHRDFRRRGHRDGGAVAIDRVSVAVQPGEMMVLLGPSGCGKTTLLRSIAGLETPDEGRITIDGSVVFSSEPRRVVPPERRGVGMVFQSYAIWPHMTVFDNVAYPLRGTGARRPEIAERVRQTLNSVNCSELHERYPHQLSGGQQQRVALARALVGQQRVILFDEPLSNIDAKVREQLRLELMSLQRSIGFSGIYVTHDQAEAMMLGHRIAVMESGQLRQVGTPHEIYDAPVSKYVAGFVGAANFITGHVRSASASTVEVETSLGTIVSRGSHHPGCVAGAAVSVFFRPEACRVVSGESDLANRWPVSVEAELYLGTHYETIVCHGRDRIVMTSVTRVNDGIRDTSVDIHVDPDRVGVYPEQSHDTSSI